ncbi:DUF7657 domain-containing protein [Larkinella arboricola]
MSKKKKIPAQPILVKNTTQPVKTDVSASRPAALAEKPVETVPQGFRLIHFDKRLKWFLGVCFGLFVLLTLAKIHYSSIPYWNQVIPDGSDPKRGLISGKPLPIRVDEWGVSTPFILSQVQNGFPLENQALGGERPALVGYYPVKHLVSVFRPDYWGFFLLSPEQGYAWWWQFKVIGSLVALTLLLMLLTRNNFWLSVFGAFWLVFSSGVARWSFYLLPNLMPGALLLVASIYLFYGRSLKTLVVNGLLFVWAFATFALALYPPYQIPLGYLLIFLLVGFVAREFHRDWLFDKLPAKLLTFGVAFAVLGAIFYTYYTDAKASIDVMSHTVYPGQRSETGGTGFIANWFSEYYGWLVDDVRFPKEWLNSCELSHFITFAPVIFLSLILLFVYTRKADPLLVAVSLFVLIFWAWIEVGFPDWLARITLLNMSPTRRAQVPFGVGNVFLTLLYLDYVRKHRIKVSGTVSALAIAGIIGLMAYVAVLNVNDSNGFFKAHQVFLPTLFFTALAISLLPFVRFPYQTAVFALAIFLFVAPNMKANPLSKGLAPITDNALYKNVRELHEQEPKARWVVIGSQYITYLVAATGVNQLSGVKNLPDFKTMRVLDPTAKRDSAYNRYAHTVYYTYIDGRDTTVINNTFEDGYAVGVDPCSAKLKQLNVKYFVFDRQPQPAETRCLRQVKKLGSIEIYRTND